MAAKKITTTEVIIGVVMAATIAGLTYYFNSKGLRFW
jgi:hypothetical protein